MCDTSKRQLENKGRCLKPIFCDAGHLGRSSVLKKIAHVLSPGSAHVQHFSYLSTRVIKNPPFLGENGDIEEWTHNLPSTNDSSRIRSWWIFIIRDCMKGKTQLSLLFAPLLIPVVIILCRRPMLCLQTTVGRRLEESWEGSEYCDYHRQSFFTECVARVPVSLGGLGVRLCSPKVAFACPP